MVRGYDQRDWFIAPYLKPGGLRCNTLIDYFSTAALGHEKNRPTSPGIPPG